MSSIPLSNEKISFTASLQEGWSGGQGSGDKSRAVKPDFPGLAREQKVLTTDEALSKPLYLHPIETVNKTQKNQGPTTRGTMNNDPVVGNFRVSANYIQNEGSEEESFFQDREAKKEGSNNNWFVADNVKWPAAGTVSFYAYAPYNYNNVSSLKWMGVDDVTQNKTIHYEVPENVEDQPDFIVAKSEGKSFTSSSANTPVDLQFSHALTAITFSVSDDMEKGKINSITIEGVKGEGDYDLSDNKWDLSNSTAAGSYTVSFDGEEGKVEGQRALTGGKNDKKVLMMIPQTLDNGAKVTINFTPTGGSATEASFPLGGTTWDPGRRITYVLSTTKIIKLNMGSVNYPKWRTAEGSAFTSEKLKSSYASGDAIGMYVVDKYNKVIEANLKFTYNDNDSKWTVEPGKEFKGSPQYNYFVYYPYQSVLPGAPAKGTPNIDVTSAKNFFADAITEWGKKFDTSSGQTIDQSDIEKMNSFDLQIGKADGLGESGTTINFGFMKHAMGLAEIVLGKTSFTNSICYLVGYKDYPTWNGTATFYASSSIKNHTMYGIADHRYISIVKPGENSFMSTTGNDAWKEEVKLSPDANEVKTGTAYSSINPTPPYPYTLAVGDIYYSDGSISHQEDALLKSTPERIPIGIVGYTTMKGDGNYWTEKGVSGKGGHALVMCLKTIGSTGSTVDAQEDYKKNGDNGPKVQTYIGTRYAWYSSASDADRTKVNSRDLLEKSCNETYGSGYTETDALIQKWGPAAAAAYQAKNYNTLPAKSSKCTGWFLPTAGQYYAVMTTLGAPFSDDWTGIWDGNTSTHPKYGFFDSMTTVTTNINDKLKKVGDSNHTEFFEDINTWVWTSSEFSSAYAVAIDSGVNDYKKSGSVRLDYGYKKNKTPVRPFLAF